MPKMVRKKKMYFVDWYRNGFCYKTTSNCPYSYVKECRKLARELGEKVEVTYSHTITEDYSF